MLGFIKKQKVGYLKPLRIFILDHRQSFLQKTLGISSDKVVLSDWTEVRNLKKMIFDGYKKALEMGVPRDESIFFIDDETGFEIIEEAMFLDLNFCLALEKSGQDVVEFEKGENLYQQIEKFKPKFVKLLVRYGVGDSEGQKQKQISVMKEAIEYARKNNVKFILEIRLRSTAASVGVKQNAFSEISVFEEISQVVKELKVNGVDPDIWHMQGMESEEDYKKIVDEVRAGDREEVGLIVMSRGSAFPQVEKWIGAGAGVRGVVGFSVGRSAFQNAIRQYRDGSKSREDCVDQIARNFLEFNLLFDRYRNK